MFELLILAIITLALMSLYTIALCAAGLNRAVARHLTNNAADNVAYSFGGRLALLRHSFMLHAVLIYTDPLEGLVHVPFSCMTDPHFMMSVFESVMECMIQSGDVVLDVEERG